MYIAAIKISPKHYSGRTIHLAGDSTMSKKLESTRPDTGWGELLTPMLCDDVRVINHAKNGRSTKSFLFENLWADLLTQLQTGDVVMIQFGHNDQKTSEPDLFTRPWHEYKYNLQQFILDVRAQGAEPVLLTSIVRRAFDSQGKLEHTLGDYPAVTRLIADEMTVNLIDLNAMTHDLIKTMGPIDSKNLFLHLTPDTHKNYPAGKQDDTHLNSEGAFKVAELVAEELVKTHPDLVCF